jgi:hypothetical protein
MGKYTAIHEAGHFLMFLKEAVRCTAKRKDGTYYWTYESFCDQAVLLSIIPDIKEGLGGKFVHYIPCHKDYNNINVLLGGMVAVHHFKKHNKFTLFDLLKYYYFNGCGGDLKQIKKYGYSNADIIKIANTLLTNISVKDKKFIDVIIKELNTVYTSNLFEPHKKGILYKQHLKRLANIYKQNYIIK